MTFLQGVQAGPGRLHAGNQPPPEVAVSSVSCVPICATLMDIGSKTSAKPRGITQLEHDTWREP